VIAVYDKYIEKIANNLALEKEVYFKEKGKMETLQEQQQEHVKRLSAVKKDIEKLTKVKLLLQNASQFAREQSKKQMEYLVTQCLQYVFDPSLEFRIEINEKASRIEAEFYVATKTKDYEIVTKPQDSRGGGVVDIISLAIRIAMMEIHEPKIEGPLILDEPAKHVSEDYIMNVSDFLKQVSGMFKRQVIMVTHNNHLLESADLCYRVEIKDGESVVTPVNLT
jgi:DNA repair exonuclease SbcCD ATPase subunit